MKEGDILECVKSQLNVVEAGRFYVCQSTHQTNTCGVIRRFVTVLGMNGRVHSLAENHFKIGRRFTVMCIDADMCVSLTLGYKYEVLRTSRDKQSYYIMGDKGNYVWVSKYRFTIKNV